MTILTPLDAGLLAKVQQACLTFTMGPAIEGGLSLVTSDSGNYYQGKLIGSNHGISASLAATWLAKHEPGTVLTPAWMATLTLAQAQQIALDELWDDIELSNVAAISPPMALMTFDEHFNRGGVHGGDFIQQLSGLPPPYDGVVGPISIAAYQAVTVDAIGKTITKPTLEKLQAQLGDITVDGVWGKQTSGAAAAHKELVMLYALRDAQYRDYASLANASENPGWFTRVDLRLTAALNLYRNPLNPI